MVNDSPVASDLSYLVLERRRRLNELTTPALHPSHRQRHISLRDFFPREDGGDAAQPSPKRIAVGEREQ